MQEMSLNSILIHFLHAYLDHIQLTFREIEILGYSFIQISGELWGDDNTVFTALPICLKDSLIFMILKDSQLSYLLSDFLKLSLNCFSTLFASIKTNLTLGWNSPLRNLEQNMNSLGHICLQIVLIYIIISHNYYLQQFQKKTKTRKA